MSIKTLNNAPALGAPSADFKARTYSIEPSVAALPARTFYVSPDEVDSFLEADNPIGCLRGVMWVMAFNAAVFLMAFVIWQSFKHLL